MSNKLMVYKKSKISLAQILLCIYKKTFFLKGTSFILFYFSASSAINNTKQYSRNVKFIGQNGYNKGKNYLFATRLKREKYTGIVQFSDQR